MLSEYIGVLLMFGIAVLLAAGLLALQLWLGPRREFPEKLEPFECGEPAIEPPRQRLPVHFYLAAILFLVFDVGGVFFYAWGATFSDAGVPGLVAIAAFTLPLAVGWMYVWRKGALEW